MKKKYQLKLFFVVLLAASFISGDTAAQIVRLSNGFDNYTGSIATVPSGWHVTWNSTSSPSYYFTAGNYGAAIPSYKFGVTQDTIISPRFLSGDTLSFWCKGQGTFSAQNVLSIYISDDSISWTQIQNLDSLPVTATTLSFPLPCSAHYLMFVYFQLSGNLAFDDVKVTMTDYFPIAVAATTLNLHCEDDSVCFFDLSTIAGCDSICNRLWDFGDASVSSEKNPCHIFPAPGTYVVTLYVMGCNGNSDSTILIITIEPNPIAQFSSINVSGTLVDLTDLSTISSGNIVTWYWSFGDSTFSIQHNPSHIYPAAGMYYACLTVSSGDGCMNTFCDSVNVIGVGIDEYDLSSEISVSPNPAKNQLAVNCNQLAIGKIEVYDAKGRNVFSRQVTALSQQQLLIDVSRWSEGIYFLKLSTETKQYSKKIIIER